MSWPSTPPATASRSRWRCTRTPTSARATARSKFLEEVGHDACGLNPDIGNFIRLHRPIEPVQDMLDKVLPHANYWHVKNYARDEDPATGQVMTFPVPMEFGLINYRAAIAPGPRPRLPRRVPVRALRQRRGHRDRPQPRLHPGTPRSAAGLTSRGRDDEGRNDDVRPHPLGRAPARATHRCRHRSRRPGRDRPGDRADAGRERLARRPGRHQRRGPGASWKPSFARPGIRTCWPCRPTSRPNPRYATRSTGSTPSFLRSWAWSTWPASRARSRCTSAT